MGSEMCIRDRYTPDPDAIPNIIWKLFAFEQAPVVAYLYNASLCEGFLPSILKRASVYPIPKVHPPPTSVENDIRPIASTCQRAKVMEGFTLSQVYDSVMRVLDPLQWAVSGKSTTDALVYLLYTLIDSLDRGSCAGYLCFWRLQKRIRSD